MKLSVLFLICSLSMTYAAESYAQKTMISLEVHNETVGTVLEKLKKESGFDFFFNNKHVDLKRIVSVSANNNNIFKILDQIFAGTNVKYSVLEKKIILSTEIVQGIQQGQNKVTGIVKDANGEPIIGANVIVKGQSTGTITDIDGRFVLDTPKDAILQITYIGYVSQEVKVSGKTELNVVLKEDTETLDEVVVVGYGVQRKSDLTGAVTRADLKTMESTPNVNMMTSLKGLVPGLNIGTVSTAGKSPDISIRGRNTISGTTTPLIVLDGVIYRGDLNDINSADVESIDILKDASSAAIYGSQAANGVILITTKHVKENTKPIIEYNATYTFQRLMSNDMLPLNREEYLKQIEHASLSKSRQAPDYMEKNPDWSVTDMMTLSSVAQGYADGTDTDWWDLTTVGNPHIQNHNLSLRGRSDLMNYFVSFGLMDQQNLFINDSYKRYNIRVNLEGNITNWLKIGTQSYFTYSDLSGANPNYSRVTRISPLTSPYNEDGTLNPTLDIGYSNPLSLIENPDTEVRYNLTGNFYADIDIPFIKGLSYRMNYSHNLVFNKDYEFNPYANALQGQGYKKNGNEYAWTWDHILTYKHDFGKHAVNATLVYGVEERGYEDTNATANIFENQTLGYDYLQAGQSDQNSIITSAWKETSLYMMARLGYTFNDRYIFNATIRRDGFSGFGANNKFAIFPSMAIGWRLSEEKFIKDKVEWLDNFKVRISYGESGNRTGGRYKTLSTMKSGNGYVYGTNSPELLMYLENMPNPDLKWESTKSLNAGLDFSVLKGRLSGYIEAYWSNTNNLLYDVNIPEINGSSSVTTNIGKIKNRGVEFSLTGVPVRSKKFDWTATISFSLNKNKVASITGLDANGDGIEDDLISEKLFIGKPYGVVYDYNIIGMWQIEDYNKGTIPNGFTFGTYKYEDVNKDGNYSAADDRKILGYTDPLYRFSIQNTFTYGPWELRAVINSVQGGSDYYYGQPLSGIYSGQQMQNYSFFNNFDYWLPENPNAKYQQLGAQTSVSTTRWVQRNFIRLQDLSLAYTFPKTLIEKVGVNRVRVFASATNLFTITDWDGWDPEAGIGITGSNSPMRQFTFGLNFEF